MGGWVKHLVDKCGKVAKLKYKSFVTSLGRNVKKTGCDKRDKVGMDGVHKA